MASQQQPGSLSQYLIQNRFGGTSTPGGPSTSTATTTPQPYDPVTGLPTQQPTVDYSSMNLPGPANAAIAANGGQLPSGVHISQTGAPPAAPTDSTMTVSRSGAGHFGIGAPSADPNSGTTPTQTGPQPYLEDAYKQLGGAYLSPSYMDTSMGGLQSQLSQPGAAEQFYQQAQNTQTDPYYQRLQQQGMDALNQQMAARGNYNSGGAIAGLGNFESGLKANQYSQMGQLAQAAQSGQQQRVGLSGQLAQAGDAGDLSRLNSFFGVAGQAQGMNQQQINSMLSQQMGIDNMGSGLMGGFYGQGGQLSGQSFSDYLNGLIQAGQARAQGQQAQQGETMGILQKAGL